MNAQSSKLALELATTAATEEPETPVPFGAWKSKLTKVTPTEASRTRNVGEVVETTLLCPITVVHPVLQSSPPYAETPSGAVTASLNCSAHA